MALAPEEPIPPLTYAPRTESHVLADLSRKPLPCLNRAGSLVMTWKPILSG